MARFIVTPEEMTIPMAESILGESADAWHGRCHEVAVVLAEHMKRAAAVYGHYLGPVGLDSYWKDRRDRPFIQHSWIVFRRTKKIMDPTRWSFEGKEPYVYYGVSAHYDIGGNEFRGLMSTPCPPFNFSDGCVHLRRATPGSAVTRHIESLISDCRVERFLTITRPQAHWLANVHYARLEPFVQEIYEALEEAGAKAFIPIDNWQRAFRKV